ncbi:MAG: sigma-54-dependent transcriptional regulator [Gemmatimonadales bacterium]
MSLVLIVDDARPLAEQYGYDLKRLGGHETLISNEGREALDTVAREPVDCVLLDLEMPGMDGFEVLRQLARRGLSVPVIVYTGTGDYDRCAQAIRLGAVSFIDKAEPMERVVQEIAGVLERGRLVREVAALQRELGGDALIGSSPAMQKLRDAIARVAPIPSPVLLVGESGSGKEVVARELHRQSGVPGPFVAINCAALPHDLIESELFGHERGAFTGAVALRKGAFEATAAGTLLLDEIGELPLPAQAKLLRVLEQRQVTRVGGTRTIAVDARVVAATNRDLEAGVKAGSFREDLLYRLNVHVLPVPPLRERLSDVPELVAHLVAVTCGRFRMRPRALTGEAVECLMAHDWGRNNVRELRNVVERMLIASDDDPIGVADVPPEIRDEGAARRVSAGAEPRTFHELKAEAERQIVVAALERHAWHITRTAEALGLADHASLLKVMRRHGISRE